MRKSVGKDNEVRDFLFHCCVRRLGHYAAYVSSYRRFGTTYLDNGTDRLSRNVGKILRCLTSKSSEYLKSKCIFGGTLFTWQD